VLWPKCEEHTLKASKLFVRVNNQFSKLVKELKFAHLVDATSVFITMQDGRKVLGYFQSTYSMFKFHICGYLLIIIVMLLIFQCLSKFINVCAVNTYTGQWTLRAFSLLIITNWPI